MGVRVVVVGGGIVGLSSAYELVRAGTDVTVLDSDHRAGAGATGANAGIVAPAHTAAWNSPAMLAALPRLLVTANDHIQVAAPADTALWRWGTRFLRNCTRARFRRASYLRWRLVRESRALLLDLLEETGIDCALRTGGGLFVHEDLDGLLAQFDALSYVRSLGESVEVVDPDRAVDLEPALATGAGRLAGALFSPSVVSGDCAAFVRGLEAVCGTLGVAIRRGIAVTGLRTGRGAVTGVTTADGATVACDAAILAAGAHTPRLLDRGGAHLGLYPVKGYALTWRSDAAEGLPHMPGVDEGALVAWAPVVGGFRVTGGAELSGFDGRARRERVQRIRAAAVQRFPALAALDEPLVRTAFRPMTADGIPRVGRFRYGNLYVNTGHGDLGWSMSTASARLVARLVTGEHVSGWERALAPP